MPSSLTSVLSPSASSHRIDGIDVAQLLRNIGEATACTDPVELFRLCLAAQRVLLVPIPEDGNGAQGEHTLLARYRALSDDGRDRLISLAGHMVHRFPRKGPALALVPACRQVAGGAA